MLIRYVAIENFRGIKSLSWHVGGRIVCLVGPGDSTKTTVLDAIELALLPRWYAQFSDADFYNADISQPIRILLAIGELSDELVSDEKFGLYLRGYKHDSPIADDPDDGWEQVVTAELEVSTDLEPHWHLTKPSMPGEPKQLSIRDRERFGTARLGIDFERHLTWSRGSALTRIADGAASTSPMLALANRAANDAIAGKRHDDLDRVSDKAREAAVEFGVRLSQLRPGLDTYAMPIGSAALSLHNEARLPLRTIGLGSRRLTGLAIQQTGLGEDAILLIDELEHSLEPHRIRRVLKKLVEKDGSPKASGQVFMTTHSPTPIMALKAEDLRFVRSDNGITTINSVTNDSREIVQSIIRRLGHALLARKIIVCEGKTEEALCRALDVVWADRHNGESLAYRGVVAVDGQGRSSGPIAAQELCRLGYSVCFFGDSDEPLDVTVESLRAIGVNPLVWPGNTATEQRLTMDLPLRSLQALINTAIEIKGAESVLNVIGQKLNVPLVATGPQLSDWITDTITVEMIRTAIGQAAKKTLNGWFKDLNAGEKLGRVVIDALPEMDGSETSLTLSMLESWSYAD